MKSLPKFMPNVFGKDEEVHKQASPINQVKAGLPPFLILCADKDFAGCGKVPSEKFCKALKEKENRAEMMEIKNSDHMRIILSAAKSEDPVFAALSKFVKANSEK